MLHRSKTVEPVMTGTTKDTAKKPRSPARAPSAMARPSEVPLAMAAVPPTPLKPAMMEPVTIEPVTIEAEPAITDAAIIEAEPAPAVPAAPLPSPPVLIPFPPRSFFKDNIMATAFGTTGETVNETVNQTVKATVSQFNESAEAAMSSGKEAMEKITAQAKDAAESSMKSIEEMTDLARGNVEAMLASARVAAAGFETLAAHISDVSRKSFESTTTAARALTSAKSPNEMFQLQSDFAKTQFDVAVSEFSKMTEMMVKLSGEVMEPVQNRLAVATDKMKAAFTK
jgi:phasin family protein